MSRTGYGNLRFAWKKFILSCIEISYMGGDSGEGRRVRGNQQEHGRKGYGAQPPQNRCTRYHGWKGPYIVHGQNVEPIGDSHGVFRPEFVESILDAANEPAIGPFRTTEEMMDHILGREGGPCTHKARIFPSTT